MAVNIKKEFGNTRNRKPDISTLVYGKIPPQAPEIEEAVLGAILLERDKLLDVVAILPSADIFYTPANQKIYAAVLELVGKSEPVDLLTVTEQLRKSDSLELVGGPYYLTNLTMNVVTSAHAESHARIIKEKYIARELIRVSGEIISMAYEDSTDVFELCDKAYEDLTNVVQVKSVDDWKTILQISQELLTHMDEVKNNPPGIPTGFPSIDKANSGFQPGDFIVVGARPSMGKSALMLVMVMAAARVGKKVGVISLEMMNKSLLARMVGMDSGISFKEIYNNYLNEPRLKEVFGTMEKLSGLPVYFSDTAQVNTTDIASKAWKLRRKHGLDILFIDYLQLVEGDKSQTRYEAVTAISRKLKVLAMSMKIPVIALAQLNREGEQKKRKPQMSDLRDSGGIEQDADGVVLLHRDWRMGITQDENGNSTENQADLIIEKWRNGEPVSLKLHFDGPTMAFSEPKQDTQFTPPPNPYAGIRGKHDTESF